MLEMNASGDVEENRNPLGSSCCNVGALFCVPTTSLAHGGAEHRRVHGGGEGARARLCGRLHNISAAPDRGTLSVLYELKASGSNDNPETGMKSHRRSTRDALRAAPEQSRARYPDSEGFVERNGQRHLL